MQVDEIIKLSNKSGSILGGYTLHRDGSYGIWVFNQNELIKLTSGDLARVQETMDRYNLSVVEEVNPQPEQIEAPKPAEVETTTTVSVPAAEPPVRKKRRQFWKLSDGFQGNIDDIADHLDWHDKRGYYADGLFDWLKSRGELSAAVSARFPGLTFEPVK